MSAYANDDPVARRQMITSLLQNTISTLCKNMLQFESDLCIEGLLGVTVDKTDILLISIKETVTLDSATNDNNSGSSSSKPNAMFPSTSHPAQHSTNAPMLTKLENYHLDKNRGNYKNRGDNCLNDVLVARHGQADFEEVNQAESSQIKTLNAIESVNAQKFHSKKKKSSPNVGKLCRTNETQIKQEIDYNVAAEYCQQEFFNESSPSKSVRKRMDEHLVGDTSSNYLEAQEQWSNMVCGSDSFKDDTDEIVEASVTHSIGRHHGRMTYQCLMCTRRFTTKNHLKRHVNAIHSYTPTLSLCPVCNRPFRRQDTMMRHFKNCHRTDGNVTIDDITRATDEHSLVIL